MVNINHAHSKTNEARNHFIHTDTDPTQRFRSTQIHGNSNSLRAHIAEFLPANFNRKIQFKDEEDREIILDVADIAEASIPIVRQINISDDSRVHFGTECISIEETLYTEEESKDGVPDLELKTKKNNTIRCSILIFVCCSILVGSGMAHFYIIHEIQPRRNTIIDLGINKWWYFRRKDWEAMPRNKTHFLNLPLRYVIIAHSGTNACKDKSSCIEEVQAMQFHDQNEKSWNDIGPNFIVSGEGLIFEGRGANIQSKMVEHYDSKSITIKFLGDYKTNLTVPQQFHHLNDVLTQLVKKEVLVKKYQFVGHCQLDPTVESPGVHIMQELISLTHWWPHNSQMCFMRNT